MKFLRNLGLKRVSKHLFFSLWQVIFDLLPLFPLRIWWLKTCGAHIGKHAFIDKIDFINLDQKGLSGLSIGSKCFIGRGSLLDLAGSITIEDYATISPKVIVLSHQKVGLFNHPLLRKYPPLYSHTFIRKNTFIGAGAILNPGIEIGEGSLVGSGAVVVNSVPSHKIVVGIPAKVIKSI